MSKATIKLIPIKESLMDYGEMSRTKGGDNEYTDPAGGGACCICNPNQSATGIGGSERAKH